MISLTDQKTQYMYHKHQQISHTFYIKVLLKIGYAAYLREYLDDMQ